MSKRPLYTVSSVVDLPAAIQAHIFNDILGDRGATSEGGSHLARSSCRSDSGGKGARGRQSQLNSPSSLPSLPSLSGLTDGPPSEASEGDNNGQDDDGRVVEVDCLLPLVASILRFTLKVKVALELSPYASTRLFRQQEREAEARADRGVARCATDLPPPPSLTLASFLSPTGLASRPDVVFIRRMEVDSANGCEQLAYAVRERERVRVEVRAMRSERERQRQRLAKVLAAGADSGAGNWVGEAECVWRLWMEEQPTLQDEQLPHLTATSAGSDDEGQSEPEHDQEQEKEQENENENETEQDQEQEQELEQQVEAGVDSATSLHDGGATDDGASSSTDDGLDGYPVPIHSLPPAVLDALTNDTSPSAPVRRKYMWYVVRRKNKLSRLAGRMMNEVAEGEQEKERERQLAARATELTSIVSGLLGERERQQRAAHRQATERKKQEEREREWGTVGRWVGRLLVRSEAPADRRPVGNVSLSSAVGDEDREDVGSTVLAALRRLVQAERDEVLLRLAQRERAREEDEAAAAAEEHEQLEEAALGRLVTRVEAGVAGDESEGEADEAADGSDLPLFDEQPSLSVPSGAGAFAVLDAALCDPCAASDQDTQAARETVAAAVANGHDGQAAANSKVDASTTERHLRRPLEHAGALYLAEAASQAASLNVHVPSCIALGRQVGKGGYGAILAGKVTASCGNLVKGQQVVVKRLPHGSTRERRANAAELGTLSLVQHPNIVRVLAAAERDREREAWLVLELVDGGTLRHTLDCVGALPPSTGAVIINRVLRALDCLHALDIVHRDIKASNVMLGLDGAVKVIDMGLAIPCAHKRFSRLNGLVDDKSQPRTLIPLRHLAGTVHYMPPELILGLGTSPKGDVYATGILAYEVLSGTVPFPSGTRGQVLYRTAVDLADSGLAVPMDAYGKWGRDAVSAVQRATSRRASVRPAVRDWLEGRGWAGAKTAGGDEEIVSVVQEACMSAVLYA